MCELEACKFLFRSICRDVVNIFFNACSDAGLSEAGLTAREFKPSATVEMLSAAQCCFLLTSALHGASTKLVALLVLSFGGWRSNEVSVAAFSISDG